MIRHEGAVKFLFSHRYTPECSVLAFMYVLRLLSYHPHLRVTPRNCQRLLLCSVMVAQKIRRYLPRDVVRLLRVLDKEWKRRISQGEYSVAWRVATVALCVEIKILRRVRAESSRRPLRHRHDACSMAWRCRFLAARPSQDGSVIAEK